MKREGNLTRRTGLHASTARTVDVSGEAPPIQKEERPLFLFEIEFDLSRQPRREDGFSFVRYRDFLKIQNPDCGHRFFFDAAGQIDSLDLFMLGPMHGFKRGRRAP